MPSPAAVIFVDPIDVDRRLAQLDLTRAALENAILFGDAEARSCTENDPRLLRGILRWGRMSRRLCEELIPEPFGWRREEYLGYPTIVHPSRAWCVAVQTGNDQTADPQRTPSTRYPRGRVTREVIARNAQMELFDRALQPYPEPPATDPAEMRTTWLLLVAVQGDVIKAELSAPCAFDLEGRPCRYSERIILSDIDRGFAVGRIQEPPTEFDVDVRRHGDA